MWAVWYFTIGIKRITDTLKIEKPQNVGGTEKLFQEENNIWETQFSTLTKCIPT